MSRRHGPKNGGIKRREFTRDAVPTGNPCPTAWKVRYVSRRLARAQTVRHLGLHAYRCPCGFWHVTSCDADGRAAARERLR